jgi:hypothetical protein
MSIDNFLNDLDKQGEEFKKKQKIAEDARLKRETEDSAFIQEFNSHYSREVTKIFKTLKEKLKERFVFVYDRTTASQQINVFAAVIQISPKFDTTIKTITVTIIGEAGRRLITISGNAIDVRNNEFKDGIVPFQDSFDKFKELDLDNEISKVLQKYFLNK